MKFPRRSRQIEAMSLVERIKSRIREDPKTGCWLYVGHLDRKGYGRIGYHLSHYMVHRVMLSEKLGRGLTGQANHHCDVRNCCNPDHLYEGDQKQNVWDSKVRGRHTSGDGKRCRHGHELTPENTFIGSDGARRCRLCRNRRSREEKKARYHRDPEYRAMIVARSRAWRIENARRCGL